MWRRRPRRRRQPCGRLRRGSAADKHTPPAAQQKMHELAPGSEILWFDEAGHCLPLEEPERVSRAIERFLGKLEAGER